MSIGAPAAADVPGIFDVVINGHGYIFLRTIDTSLPFRTQRAKYSRTPTFVQRQNTTGQYGDNQQDFFLTESQHNWVLGEQQKFYLPDDSEGQFRFWKGTNLNIDVAGQATLKQDTNLVNGTQAPWAASGDFHNQVWMLGSSNVYRLNSTGNSITAGPAHGLATTVNYMALDPNSGNIYLSDTTQIKLLTTTGTGSVAAFSATGCRSICVLNQILYGFDTPNGRLVSYGSTGVQSTVFQFKDPSGNNVGPQGTPVMKRFGGKLLMLFTSELWQYDGTNTNIQAELPTNFFATDLKVEEGIAYIGGYFTDMDPSGGVRTSAMFQWNGSSIDLVWKSSISGISGEGTPVMVRFGGGILFYDSISQRIMSYNISTGAINGVASWSGNAGQPIFASNGFYAAIMDSASANGIGTYPSQVQYAASGTLETGLFDFGNSLTKQFRGVKVDFVPATDGNGGSVDIAYQVDSVDGNYTTLQSGVTAGQEYLFTSVSGRSISIKITLNRGTSTKGPTLKRVYMRASPQLQSYRDCEYMLDCSGVNGETPVIVNDNETAHPKDGLAQAQDLQTAVTASSPISITDRFGTFTGIIKPDESEFIEIAPEEYIVRLAVREV